MAIVEIRFKKSRSAAFSGVLKECRMFSGFSENGNEYTLIIENMSDVFLWARSFFYILGTIIKWKHVEIYFNGILVANAPYNLYYNLKDLTSCYLGYKQSDEGVQYCNAIGNGCRRIEHVNLDGISGFVFKRWYKFGTFVGPYRYEIDKAAIMDTVRSEAEDKNLFSCPVFSLELVKVIVDLLPNYIDTRQDIWMVNYETIETDNGEITVPLSIDINDNWNEDYSLIKAEKPIIEMSESELNEWLDSGQWKD